MAIERKPSLTEQAHRLIQEHFWSLDKNPKHAVDATCGNGFDTVFLASWVSEAVYAFDIQDIAIKNTQHKLQELNLDKKVKLIKSGHETLSNYIENPVDIIMFNLGYLPQADKSVTTLTETSIKALNSALALLSNNGILSLLCYPGHSEGKKETVAIRKFLMNDSKKFIVNEYLSNYPNEKSPILFLIKHA